MKNNHNLICGIDIGNYAIKTVVAELDREFSRPKILGCGRALSHGLRRGVVTDMAELVSNIRESVNRAEAIAGVKITRAYASISGMHIGNQLSRGVIIVSRADNEISQHDVDRVVEAASTINLPANRQIIHRIPKNFIIDAQESVKNALGMKGVRLEAEVLLIEGLAPHINNLAKCINSNDIEVADFVFAPLAASRSVLDKHQREHGVLHVDFGGGSSTLSLFHEGELLHAAVLPIGSRHITYDLAVAFRIPMDKAEIIKCAYGYVGYDDGNRKENVDLSEVMGEENFVIPRKQITRIIDARVSELFDMIDEELKKVSYKYILPAGLVISGGGANLKGLLPYAKNRLKLAGHIGTEFGLEGAQEQLNDPAFAVAIGLIAWGIERDMQTDQTFGSRFSNMLPSGGLKKFNKWLKDFLP